jgi:hypothetical protein
MAARHGVQHLIELMPPVGYRDALAEMLRADALLVLQAADCNEQIPAKLYEYFRARRPLLALTDEAGDTAAALRDAGCNSIAPLDDAHRIAALLVDFMADEDRGASRVANEASINKHSRRHHTSQFAALLDRLV